MALISRNKPPDYVRFGLPEVPAHVKKAWRICGPGNDLRPIQLRLADGSQDVWVAGWLAPANPAEGLSAGIDVYWDGILFVSHDSGFMPEYVMNLSGVVGCIPCRRRSSRQADVLERLRPELRKELDRRFAVWLEDISGSDFQTLIQPRLEASPRGPELVKDNPTLFDLTQRYFVFRTNLGRKTVTEILTQGGLETFTPIAATSALHFEHPLLATLAREQILLVDLRDYRIRALADRIFSEAGRGIDYVDTAVAQRPVGLFLQCTPSTTDLELRDWFARHSHVNSSQGCQNRNSHSAGITSRYSRATHALR